MADMSIKFPKSTGNTAMADSLTFGVYMGESFLSEIMAPPPMKEILSYNSRAAHGRVYDTGYPYMDARDMNLTFRIVGDGETQGEKQSSLLARYAVFVALLQTLEVDIQVPSLGNQIYHLVYTGESITFNMNLGRDSVSIKSKFIEPNPNSRT